MPRFQKSLQNKPEGTLMTRLFTSPLSHRDSRLTKTGFVLAARKFLCLPPLKDVEADIHERKCGCEYQTCSSCGNRHELDSHGNHGLTCHPGEGRLCWRRSLRGLFAELAGSRLISHTLIDSLGASSPRRTCRGSTQPVWTRLTRSATRGWQWIFCGAERTARLGALRDLDFPRLSHPVNAERADVIRYDLCFPSVSPIDCPKELWLELCRRHAQPTLLEGSRTCKEGARPPKLQ